MAEPGVYDLWVQAGGGTLDYDRGRFLELMIEHRRVVKPGDEGYEDASRDLPCGWPGRAETRPWPYDGAEGRARLTGSLETDEHAVEWDDPEEEPS